MAGTEPERSAVLSLTFLLILPAPRALRNVVPNEADYVVPDYRGKGCIDDKGLVFDVGERFYPSARACPCVCTMLGPVCRKPRCPRLPPRCARLSYGSCCPRCVQVRNSCQYGGRSYRLQQEFWEPLLQGMVFMGFCGFQDNHTAEMPVIFE